MKKIHLPLSVLLVLVIGITPVRSLNVQLVGTEATVLNLEIRFSGKELGVYLDNSTLLFLLGSSHSGRWQSPDFQVEDVRISPSNLKIETNYDSYDLHAGSGPIYADGVAFQIKGALIGRSSDPIRIRARLTTKTNFGGGYFLRWNSLQYPFDSYDSGLALFVFHDYVLPTRTPTLECVNSVKFQTSHVYPEFRMIAAGNVSQAYSWGEPFAFGAIFLNDEIEFHRSQIERSLFPISLFVGLVLVALIAYLGWRGEEQGRVVAVYVSPVLSSLGILQQLSDHWAIATIPTLIVVLLVAQATACLVLSFVEHRLSPFPLLFMACLLVSQSEVSSYVYLCVQQPYLSVLLIMIGLVPPLLLGYRYGHRKHTRFSSSGKG